MLRRLSIRNYVLISSLDIELGAGMAVFTGETGAGKSILLDALGLALGARGASGVVGRGSERASVAALFDIAKAGPVRALLDEHDLDRGGELLLRRVIGADGRSRAFVNDTPTGIALLRSIGGLLVEIDGQSEPGGLLDAAGHLAMLDDFAGHGMARESLARAHAAWRAAEAAQQEAEAAQEAARREEDYLRHAVAELEALAPECGEEARRAAERTTLMNGHKIAEALQAAGAEIGSEGGVGARLRAARRTVERAAPAAGGMLDGLLESLEQAAIESEEAEGALEAALRALESDPGRLEAVEERLFSLRAAARKHRTEPDALVPLLSRLQGELDAIEGGAERLATLGAETEAARHGLSRRGLGTERRPPARGRGARQGCGKGACAAEARARALRHRHRAGGRWGGEQARHRPLPLHAQPRARRRAAAAGKGRLRRRARAAPARAQGLSRPRGRALDPGLRRDRPRHRRRRRRCRGRAAGAARAGHAGAGGHPLAPGRGPRRPPLPRHQERGGRGHGGADRAAERRAAAGGDRAHALGRAR